MYYMLEKCIIKIKKTTNLSTDSLLFNKLVEN
jgi:hypothetical protein